MSNRDDQGGRPPPDDRTLLDPLSNDELEALRQARQRLQAQKKGQGGSETKKQMVIGPENDESLGHAPTRAMPALPRFDGRISLDQIGPTPESRVSGHARDPASYPADDGEGPAPSEPMSVYSGTVGTSEGSTGLEATLTPGTSIPETRGPTAGATGFGENTLMWMQPPKSSTPAVSTVDILQQPAVEVSTFDKLKKFAILAVVLLVVLAFAATMFLTGEQGVVELYTEPRDAVVRIDGKLQSRRTPVKLTMAEGVHTIELTLEGYEPKKLEIVVDPKKEGRKNVTLIPKSAPGLMTVSINVQPVSATIELDGNKHPSKRELQIANVDPKRPHVLKVEAPGYKKVEQQIAAGELRSSYNFVLQPKSGDRPE